MKNSRIFCLFLIHFFAFSFSQRTEPIIVYGIPKTNNFEIGLPYTNFKLQKDDKIISNLPIINYNTGRFQIQENPILDNLIHFLKINEKLNFKIKIYRCAKGNAGFVKDVNKHLSKSLKNNLENNSASNFIIDENDIGTCDDNLLKDTENPYYYASRSFLEITVQ